MAQLQPIHRNLTATAIEPLDVTLFDAYLAAAHASHDDYPGHGQKVIDNWETYRDTDVLPWLSGINYYDFGRAAMQAYYYRSARGDTDTRWVTYAEADARMWGKFYAANSWRPGGYRLFTDGFWMLYDYDPTTYSWCKDNLNSAIDSIYCEYQAVGMFTRENLTRELSYALLAYLNRFRAYGYSDPIHDSAKYADRIQKCIVDYPTQWMDEYADYGFANPMEYLASSGDRLANYYNLLELSPFMCALWCEAAMRLIAEDPDWLNNATVISRITEIGEFQPANGWEYDHLPMIFRWYNCGSTGDLLGWCNERGGHWTQQSDYSYDLTLFRMHLWGWLYNQTGDRKYLIWGDREWNHYWTLPQSTIDYRVQWSNKVYTQNLRYTFDYLRWRGDFPSLKTSISG